LESSAGGTLSDRDAAAPHPNVVPGGRTFGGADAPSTIAGRPRPNRAGAFHGRRIREHDVERRDRRLSRRHTFFSWSAQGAIDPIAIDRAEGVYLYTPEGQRILDFNSQLMSVNIGHGDRRVIDAITAQATKLQYVQPAFATEPRARLGAKLARSCRATSTRSS
jgi:4-aminobutyrate aminotransferase-like enzyme